MLYTLAIDDVVDVPVKFAFKSGRVVKQFAFSLTCTRLPTHEAISERMDEKEQKYKEFLTDLVTGWSGQRFVLDDKGAPVEFSADALDAMLSAPGVAKKCFDAYLKEVMAQEKN